MNNNIKERATYMVANQKNLFKTLLIVSVISSLVAIIPSVFGIFNSNSYILLTIITSIVMIPFSHGYIVSSLKEVNNRDDLIVPEKDALVGIYRYKELFLTYFVKDIIMTIVICIIAFATMWEFITSAGQILGTIAYNPDLLIFDSLLETEIISSQIVAKFFLGMLIIVIFAVMYELYFALVPYVLEKYNFTKLDAMKESARLMKGHKLQYFTLNISFILWMILASLITSVITNILGMFCPELFLSVIMAFVSSYITIYIYDMKLILCKTIFFEEIDAIDKQNNQ